MKTGDSIYLVVANYENPDIIYGTQGESNTVGVYDSKENAEQVIKELVENGDHEKFKIIEMPMNQKSDNEIVDWWYEE